MNFYCYLFIVINFFKDLEAKTPEPVPKPSKFVMLTTAIGRIMMLMDIYTDVTVSYELGTTKNANGEIENKGLFRISLALLLAQYAVLWILMWRPFLAKRDDILLNLSRRAAEGPSSKKDDDVIKHWFLSLVFEAQIWSWLFVIVYVVLGIPLLFITDILIFTVFCWKPPETNQYLLYYERLRIITEVFAESLPNIVFQTYATSQAEGVSHKLIIISVITGLIAVVKNMLQCKKTAQKLELPFWTFMDQMSRAGVGFIPHKLVQNGSLHDLVLIFPVGNQKQQLLESLKTPTCQVSTIVLRLIYFFKPFPPLFSSFLQTRF